MSDVFGGHVLAIPYRPVAELLADYAARDPAKPAIVDLDQGSRINYGQLHQAVTDIALHLRGLGVAKGSRVVVLSDEVLEKLLIWFALWRIGAVVAPLNIEMNAGHMVELTRTVDPALILVHKDLVATDPTRELDYPRQVFGAWSEPGGEADPADRLFREVARGGDPASLPERNDAADISCMFCTSGTSGRPKIVVYDHAAYWLSGLDSIDMLELTAADRTLEYRSFGWNSAQILSLMPMLQTGLTLHMARRFSQSRFFNWIADNAITFAAGVPAVINILLQNADQHSAHDVPSLSRMTCSSAPLSAEQWARFEATYGLKLVQLYGMSEAGWICGNRLRELRVGTVGQPALHQEFAIVDPTGATCPAGVEGEVSIGGPQIALGYLLEGGAIDPMRGTRAKTGDLAVMDEDGFVRVTGRTKDLIIRGGVNIAPVEIDGVLLALPGVLDGAAVGVPDPILGEEVAAYVVLDPARGLTSEAVIDHCKRYLAAAKVPKQVIVVAELPKNDRGKVIRDKLRADWLERMRNSA
jgi:acyl-coenzyme A synthetase/AMP-(fatty) acid ligase